MKYRLKSMWLDTKEWWEVMLPALATGLALTILLIGMTIIVVSTGPRPKPAVYGPEDLVYFRDDNHQQCYAMLRGRPDSLTAVSCTKGYW